MSEAICRKPHGSGCRPLDLIPPEHKQSLAYSHQFDIPGVGSIIRLDLGLIIAEHQISTRWSKRKVNAHFAWWLRVDHIALPAANERGIANALGGVVYAPARRDDHA